MSLELFLGLKNNNVDDEKDTFLATQRDETTWTFNDFGRDDGKNKNRTKEEDAARTIHSFMKNFS